MVALALDASGSIYLSGKLILKGAKKFNGQNFKRNLLKQIL